MKTILLLPNHFWILAGMFVLNISCKPSASPQHSEQQSTQDSTEIANTIHEFYRWHHAKSTDTINDFNFVDDRGDRYRLNLDLLQIYLDKLYSSGYLSRRFIQNEKNFFLECEKLWQNEEIGDVPSCLDGDHFFCAQEWELNFWVNTPVTIDYLKTDSAAVRLVGKSFDLPMERSMTLIREDASWKLASIECDMGF